jgi:hypothetical protein
MFTLLVVVFVVALFCAALVVIIPSVQRAGSYPMSPLHRKLRNICLAMAQYHAQHGSLPYSDDGPEHALYLLHPFLDDEELKWNHDLERLEDSNIEYINEKDARPYSSRVLILAKRGLTKSGVYLGGGDGITWWHDCPAPPDRSLLGSWLTLEGFLVPDLTTWEDWEQTHPSSGQHRSTTSVTDEMGTRLVQTEIGALLIRYEYADGRVAKCIITTPKGVIEEDVETDHLGRVIGLSRKPDDWKSLLP